MRLLPECPKLIYFWIHVALGKFADEACPPSLLLV